MKYRELSNKDLTRLLHERYPPLQTWPVYSPTNRAEPSKTQQICNKNEGYTMSAETMKRLLHKMVEGGITFDVCTCEGWISLGADKVPKYLAATDEAQRDAIALGCDVQKMRAWMEYIADPQCHGRTRSGARCKKRSCSCALVQSVQGRTGISSAP